MIYELLEKLKAHTIQFKDVLAYIEENYDYTSSSFENGNQHNTATENQGSARVLSLGMINELSVEDTLLLFAEHYTAVLNTPEASDHQNIRQFMQNGWSGVKFENPVLNKK